MRKILNFIFSFQFSKLLILFETIIVAYLTYKGVYLAELCIINQYTGSLPWIATMLGCAWGAYGTSVAFYYQKSKSEQLKKIEMTGSEYSCPYTDYSEPTI